jgi:membrane protein YqaA with SNARE-associated domain
MLMPDMGLFAIPIEPFATLAAEPWILIVLAAWGFGEALLLPVVPDVLIGLLVLAAPWQVGPLLGAAVVGGVAGSIPAWWLLRRRPGVAGRILAAQPGLGDRGLAEAEDRLQRRGLVAGFAQLGPGLPLKAYLHALAIRGPATGTATVAGLALVNRLTRLGPVALVFAALHPVAVAMAWSAALLTILWLAGWTAFYVAYWIARNPRRDP